jgi:hypothetical protein
VLRPLLAAFGVALVLGGDRVTKRDNGIITLPSRHSVDETVAKLETLFLISYNSPAYLKERHGVPDDLVSNIAGIEALARAAAE